MKTPAEILGVSSEVLDDRQGVENYHSIHSHLDHPVAGFSDQAALLVMAAETLCEGCYLRGEWDDLRVWTDKLLDACDNYLFGDWRYKEKTDEGVIDAEAWWYREATNWTEEVAGGICWGAVCGLWERVDRILDFPDPDVLPDVDGKLIAQYYKAVAVWWKQDGEVSGLQEGKKIRGGGSKEIHQRCEILEAISNRDQTGLSAKVAAHIKFWVEKKKDCPQRLPTNASFLWHVAMRQGLRIDLPDALRQHLIIIPEG